MELFIRSILILVTAGMLTPAHGEDGWNQWRGPLRTGVSPNSPEWPDKLGEENLTELWNVGLAEGYSSPVTSAGKIYSVETKDAASEIVRAFDLESGKPVWEKSWDGAMKVPFFAKKNGSWVRSTPALSKGAVYVGGMRDVLVKLDAETGDEQWRIDFTKREETEVPSFGQVCSPLVDGNSIYVQAGLAVAKLNAETGETVWRSMEDRRAMFGSAFSSLILLDIAGEKQLIAQARLELAGLDPETGKVLWSTPVKAFRGMNILTPSLVGENQIYVASYGGGSFLFEVAKAEDGSFSVKQKWNNEKMEGYMGNPAIVGDHIYLHGRDKKLHCVAIADGKAAWTSDEKFGEYWSMIQQGNRILALDQKGELLLIEASPAEFKLLDRRVISPKDSTWAHLGIDGNKLLVRSLKGLSVYEWK